MITIKKIRAEIEEWRDVPGYEGLYQVSNTEKVKGLEREVEYPKGYRHLKEKILKPHLAKNGYYYVDLCKNGKHRPYGVHCLVAQAFPEICGNPFPGSVVNHKKSHFNGGSSFSPSAGQAPASAPFAFSGSFG